MENAHKFSVEKLDGNLRLGATIGGSGVTETWSFGITPDSREISVSIEGKTTEDITIDRLSYSFDLIQPSLSALFSTGVAQMMGKSASCLGSQDSLQRVYSLGGGSALDIVVYSATSSGTLTFVLHSDTGSTPSSVEFQVAGLPYPRLSKDLNTAWSKLCWRNDNSSAVTVPAGTAWTLQLGLVPNNYDFPAYMLRNDVSSAQLSEPEDIRTFLTGVYGSAAGCLQSYYKNQNGIVAPTISHPDVGYSPDTNFFDPDNFLAMSALLYSRDPFLQSQVRDVLLRTAQTMCGLGNTTDAAYCAGKRVRGPLRPYESRWHALRGERGDSRRGQIMHHFVSLVPTYESIAGSEQLGPNVFWTWTCLRYLAVTGDLSWAAEVFSFIDLSARYLLSFVDLDHDSLVLAPGPLWIDVLVRENYTSDSAAALVPLFRELADFYDLMSDKQVAPLPTTEMIAFATELRNVSSAISAAVNNHLWAASDDHLVTQLNLDGTVRDFVDYDSNLIAGAFGLLAEDRLSRMLQRVDSGNFTHVRATWCSEIPYSGDACDCYIVGGTVCGDSVVTLARIGYVDALTRWRIGDADFLRNVLLAPIQQDLTADTWLFERYDSTGTQIRTPFYFEYPSLVTMLLFETVMGLQLTSQRVVLCPVTRSTEQLSFKLGDVHVVFDPLSTPQRVELSLPGTSSAWIRSVHVCGLRPQTSFRVQNNGGEGVQVRTDETGSLVFSAAFFTGENWVVVEE